MKHIKVFEDFLNEAEITDPKIEKQIAYFYDLQKRITELDNELTSAKEEWKEFETDLRPMMDSMKEVKDKLATTADYIITITRFGTEKKVASYKAAFENALTKVNAATKRVLNEALEASKNLVQVKHSFTISKKEDRKVSEGAVWDSIVSGLKAIVKKFMGIFKSETAEIDDANDELKKLAKP